MPAQFTSPYDLLAALQQRLGGLNSKAIPGWPQGSPGMPPMVGSSGQPIPDPSQFSGDSFNPVNSPPSGLPRNPTFGPISNPSFGPVSNPSFGTPAGLGGGSPQGPQPVYGAKPNMPDEFGALRDAAASAPPQQGGGAGNQQGMGQGPLSMGALAMNAPQSSGDESAGMNLGRPAPQPAPQLPPVDAWGRLRTAAPQGQSDPYGKPTMVSDLNGGMMPDYNRVSGPDLIKQLMLRFARK